MKLIQSQAVSQMRKGSNVDDAGEEEGIEEVYFGQLKKSDTQSEITALDVAIIAFWKLNSDQSFECYH